MYLGVIALAIIVLILLTVVLNPILPVWFCRKMGWHLAPKEQSFDGASFNGTCPRCGVHVLQDSQGNWFS
jgi:hypothetical protein